MDGMVFFNINGILVVSLCFTALLPDAESNFPYFKKVLNFSGTIMVHFNAKHRKPKQSILKEKIQPVGLFNAKIVNSAYVSNYA